MKFDETDDVIPRQMTANSQPSATDKEFIKFHDQANGDQQYNTPHTNLESSTQNEGVPADTHSSPHQSTTIPTSAGTSSRGR